MSDGPSKWNVSLTGGGGNRGRIRFGERINAMIVLTRPIGKGNVTSVVPGFAIHRCVLLHTSVCWKSVMGKIPNAVMRYKP